ncbi:MAG: hypothetical protein A2736_00370 [Candidatus Yanofskybacteria bacterium RIFCSPHIGHO2_01_FULL_41_27]|uniref:Uncharacterized protein n=3 Tax=Parcubacteria group TaxID=1794811 RepID=A0A1F8HTW8_9BACT|nr:MAG: hypothetical protein UU83_C0019G0018 [Candidatus Jorgensenbacteria bacterium GW2011_GWF2_41_8]OGN00388.1 MAG: hypothetical protein A2736_00370 [Candidatus Yanofskybacteria bacterium RIFCSPHIGHO2_01_FULL_41_27]OGN41021.1 MAG: hypothetical protein A2606_03760 [Candidatus Yanofskybacteria bacterium RIFOXYD1_FULL_42_10]
MFLPNTYSFVLTRGTIVDPSFTPEARRGVFLPNTDSFLLRRRPIVEPSFTPEAGDVVATIPQSTDSEQSKVNDQGKRTFLKVASIAGASAIASQILSPKKASAFIMGSSPTTGVVGVKNSANARINPATEETVSTLATQATAATILKTTDLALDAGVLQVKVTSTSGEGSSSFSDSGDVAKSGLVDGDRHVQVDVLSSSLPTTASTETTLQTISFGGFKFTLRLDTVGDIDYVGEAAIGTATSAASWRIKRVDSTTGVIIQWAGTGVFDQVWNNRASLSYS